MIDLHIQNETDKLEAVILGTAESFGGEPSLEDAYDPKTKEFIEKGEFPLEADLISEMSAFAAVLAKYDVKVYRPKVIEGLNQVFSRDISFVIGNRLVIPNIIQDRLKEIDAIQHVIDQVNQESIIEMPEGARAEGGDVMPWNEYLFVGYSEPEDFKKYVVARTNRDGLNFLEETFPDRKVKGFELVKSDTDPRKNALHLDCCFQPIGRNSAILYKGGFKNAEDYEFLVDYFGRENVIDIDSNEMYRMFSNVFSISPDVVVSEQRFTRLNNELRNRGFTVEEVPYFEVSKMEGLLRCSTMPLRRTN